MFKLLVICAVLSLFFLCSNAQAVSPVSPKELKQLIHKSQPDTNRISLMLKLGSYYLFKQGSVKSDMDSAKTAFNTALQLSDKLSVIKWKIETLKLLGVFCIEDDDFFHGRAYFLKAIEECRKMKDKKAEAFTWIKFGDCINVIADRVTEKVNCYKNAGLIFHQLHERLYEIKMFKSVADIHMNIGQLDLAEREFLQIIKMYKAINYKDLHNMGGSLKIESFNGTTISLLFKTEQEHPNI